jgi:5-keto 4-deoxyuronate isomerase
MIFGGVTPAEIALEIKLDKELGVKYFLERRELGVINIGGKGSITIDGKKEEMVKHDGYYIGKGTEHVVFESDDASILLSSMLFQHQLTRLIQIRNCHLKMHLRCQLVIKNI